MKTVRVITFWRRSKYTVKRLGTIIAGVEMPFKFKAYKNQVRVQEKRISSNKIEITVSSVPRSLFNFQK